MRTKLLCLVVCVIVCAIASSYAWSGAQPNRVSLEMYSSKAAAAQVTSGHGYFALRLVEASFITKPDDWFTKWFGTPKENQSVVVTLHYTYGVGADTTVPAAWGEVRPGLPLLDRRRVFLSPQIPVATEGGVTPQLLLDVGFSRVPAGEKSVLDKITMVAQGKSFTGAFPAYAPAVAAALPYFDLIADLVKTFWPPDLTGQGLTVPLPAFDTGQAPRYVLFAAQGSSAVHTVGGKAVSRPWDRFDDYLVIPSGNAGSGDHVKWNDGTELAASYILFEVETLGPRFDETKPNYVDLVTTDTMYESVRTLFEAPLTQALEKATDKKSVKDTYNRYINQLLAWLRVTYPSMIAADRQVVAKVVGQRALAAADIEEAWRPLLLPVGSPSFAVTSEPKQAEQRRITDLWHPELWRPKGQ